MKFLKNPGFTQKTPVIGRYIKSGESFYYRGISRSQTVLVDIYLCQWTV